MVIFCKQHRKDTDTLFSEDNSKTDTVEKHAHFRGGKHQARVSLGRILLKAEVPKIWLFLQGKENFRQTVAELLMITSLSLAVGRKSK